MRLDIQVLTDLHQQDHLLIDNTEKILEYFYRNQITFSDSKGYFPKPVLFVDPAYRETVAQYLKDQIDYHRNDYYYRTKRHFLNQPVKIHLSSDVPEASFPSLPIMLTIEILEEQKIFYSLRQNRQSFNGFDVSISRSSCGDSPIPYVIDGVEYHFFISR